MQALIYFPTTKMFICAFVTAGIVTALRSREIISLVTCMANRYDTSNGKNLKIFKGFIGERDKFTINDDRYIDFINIDSSKLTSEEISKGRFLVVSGKNEKDQYIPKFAASGNLDLLCKLDSNEYGAPILGTMVAWNIGLIGELFFL
jgi:hypothetical protein